jgi:hypothetical protein
MYIKKYQEDSGSGKSIMSIKGIKDIKGIKSIKIMKCIKDGNGTISTIRMKSLDGRDISVYQKEYQEQYQE